MQNQTCGSNESCQINNIRYRNKDLLISSAGILPWFYLVSELCPLQRTQIKVYGFLDILFSVCCCFSYFKTITLIQKKRDCYAWHNDQNSKYLFLESLGQQDIYCFDEIKLTMSA